MGRNQLPLVIEQVSKSKLPGIRFNAPIICRIWFQFCTIISGIGPFITYRHTWWNTNASYIRNSNCGPKKEKKTDLFIKQIFALNTYILTYLRLRLLFQIIDSIWRKRKLMSFRAYVIRNKIGMTEQYFGVFFFFVTCSQNVIYSDKMYSGGPTCTFNAMSSTRPDMMQLQLPSTSYS